MQASLDYQVFLTRNSEYHLQRHVCVGVRDRRTGSWVEGHPALQRALTSTVRTAGELAVLQRPQLGESLEFDLDGAPLRTSPVLNIEQRKQGPQSEATGTFTRPPSNQTVPLPTPAAPAELPVTLPGKRSTLRARAKREWPRLMR